MTGLKIRNLFSLFARFYKSTVFYAYLFPENLYLNFKEIKLNEFICFHFIKTNNKRFKCFKLNNLFKKGCTQFSEFYIYFNIENFYDTNFLSYRFFQNFTFNFSLSVLNKLPNFLLVTFIH